jgi:hypothetical protein
MPRYRQSFLNEVARFERCWGEAPANDIGLAQFFAFESHGRYPSQPDAYFLRLLEGKRWWEWTLNEFKSLRASEDWWGWAQIEIDFADDPRGLQQVRDRIGAAKFVMPLPYEPCSVEELRARYCCEM